MSSTHTAPARAAGVLFDGLLPQPPDAVLAVSKMFREDPRPAKIDVGVGVYRDANGHTPVFAAMKAAEARLLETQETKAYLGPEGDFTINSSDPFPWNSHQHDANYVTDHRIVLFDNANTRCETEPRSAACTRP